jgi:HD domain
VTDLDDKIAGVEIPDTALVRDATDLVRSVTDDVLFDHSRRVYLWGMLHSRRRGLAPDPELLYVGAMFHDLGLTEKYGRTDSIEFDGAYAAWDFLLGNGFSIQEARTIWLAIALQSALPVPEYLSDEITLLSAGIATDVLGLNLDALTVEEIQQITTAHPTRDFKIAKLRGVHSGRNSRPGSTTVAMMSQSTPPLTGGPLHFGQ